MSRNHPDAADDGTPAGSPAEQRALDRPWRLWATGVVVGAVALAALLGFLIIPAGQRENAGLSLYGAICRAVGISPGSPAERQPQSRAVALPVSVVSWDPEIMETLASRDNPRGAALAAQVCAACHGEKGLSQSNIPSLAGQSSYAIYKQLSDYRSGARVHPQMSPVARQLSEKDLAAIAAYFAYASREYAALGARDLIGEPEIERLAYEGDSSRALPACLSCHVNGSGGPIETPVITGQSADYILAQLDAYANGTRKNDVYGRMRYIAAKLSPQERAALARYFEGTI